ncbi:MAG: hypothetical protein ACTSR3_15890, partial [Candidatus Helarchaeota archaeon]
MEELEIPKKSTSKKQLTLEQFLLRPREDTKTIKNIKFLKHSFDLWAELEGNYFKLIVSENNKISQFITKITKEQLLNIQDIG